MCGTSTGLAGAGSSTAGAGSSTGLVGAGTSTELAAAVFCHLPLTYRILATTPTSSMECECTFS